MPDTRKTKQKPTGKSQPSRGTGTGTKPSAKSRQPDKGKLARAAARAWRRRSRQRTLLWTGVAVGTVVALLALIWWQGREEAPAGNPQVSEAAREAGRTAAGSQGVQSFRRPAGPTSTPASSPATGTRTRRPQATTWPTGSSRASTTASRTPGHGPQPGARLRAHALQEPPRRPAGPAAPVRRGPGRVQADPGPLLRPPQDGVALAAWRNLEVLQRVNIDVVQAFVNDYMVPDASKSQAPEPNAA